MRTPSKSSIKIVGAGQAVGNRQLDPDALWACVSGLVLVGYAGKFAAASRQAARRDANRKRFTLAVYEGDVSCRRRRSEKALDIDEEGNWLTTIVMQDLAADAKNFLRATSIGGRARVHYLKRDQAAFVIAIEALPETILTHVAA